MGPVREAVLEAAARDVNAGPDATDLHHSDRRVWVLLMRRAGFWVPDSRDPKRGRPLYKPHDMRHTFGSLML